MNESAKTMGENIKRLRKEKKLTQTALGQLIGKSESTIRKYEAGTVQPSWDIISTLSDVLNVEFIELTNKLYSSEDEMYQDTIERIENERFSDIDNIFNDFKQLLHYTIQLKAFENEFNLDFKKLTEDEILSLKREIYRGIQYACFTIKDHPDKK